MIKIYCQSTPNCERKVALTTDQLIKAVLDNWSLAELNCQPVQIDFDADASDPHRTTNCCALMFHDMFDIKVFSYGSYNMESSYHSNSLYLNAEENNLVDDHAAWIKDAIETAVGDLDANNGGLVFCDLVADSWLETWLHANYSDAEIEVVNNS